VDQLTSPGTKEEASPPEGAEKVSPGTVGSQRRPHFRDRRVTRANYHFRWKTSLLKHRQVWHDCCNAAGRVRKR